MSALGSRFLALFNETEEELEHTKNALDVVQEQLRKSNEELAAAHEQLKKYKANEDLVKMEIQAMREQLRTYFG